MLERLRISFIVFICIYFYYEKLCIVEIFMKINIEVFYEWI